jgi:hypothetical protein
MNESKPTCREHPPVQAPMARLFCGGCAQFDREAWETVRVFLATIAELCEELATLHKNIRSMP